MGKTTAIAWTDHTWNPWIGCEKVSPGCAHCYAETLVKRWGHDFGTLRRTTSVFNDPLRWKEPARVFTCSLSDWFHPQADAWRPDAWAIVRQSPHLTFQILTKRPEFIRAGLPPDWGDGYPNVWLGTSVENQRFAHRAAILAQIPARRRFISAEPLLGPVNLTDFAKRDDGGDFQPIHYLHQVIVGGESGANPRPMELAWARSLRDQCRANYVAFFLKQLGGHPDARKEEKAVLDGETWTEYPDP